MDGFNRERPPFAFQDRCLGQAPPQIGDIKRCRHQHNRKVGPEHSCGFSQQRQAQIRVPSALMKFVEQNAGDIFQRGVGLQSPKKNSVCDDVDHGLVRALAFAADAIPDPFPQPLVQRVREACSRCLCCQSARLHHPDLPRSEGWVMSLIECSDQGQGHPGRFARSRGSLKQQRLPGQNLAAEVRQEHVDRVVI